MRHPLVLSALGLALFAAVPLANAATMTNTFNVTAMVPAICKGSFNTTTLAFGIYTPGGGDQAGQSTISVTCTNGTPFTVALDAGLNAGGASNFTARAMKSGTNLLTYQLYSDLNHSTVWGDGSNSSSTVGATGVGMGTATTLTVYGLIPDAANLAAAVGSNYSDTVTVSVTY